MEVKNLVQELLEGSMDVKTSVDILAASLIEANNYPSRVPRRAGVRVSFGKGALDKTIPGMLWKGLVAPAGKGATDGLKSLAKSSGEAVGSLAKEALGGVGVDTSKISVSSSRTSNPAPKRAPRVQDTYRSGSRSLIPSSPGGEPISSVGVKDLKSSTHHELGNRTARLPGNRSYLGHDDYQKAYHASFKSKIMKHSPATRKRLKAAIAKGELGNKNPSEDQVLKWIKDNPGVSK